MKELTKEEAVSGTLDYIVEDNKANITGTCACGRELNGSIDNVMEDFIFQCKECGIGYYIPVGDIDIIDIDNYTIRRCQ